MLHKYQTHNRQTKELGIYSDYQAECIMCVGVKPTVDVDVRVISGSYPRLDCKRGQHSN